MAEATLCEQVVGERAPLELPAGTLTLLDGERWVSATLSVDRETGRLVTVTDSVTYILFATPMKTMIGTFYSTVLFPKKA